MIVVRRPPRSKMNPTPILLAAIVLVCSTFGSLVFNILLPAVEGAQAKTGNPASTVSGGGAARRAAVARMASRAARAPSSVTGRTSGLHADRQAASRHNRKIMVAKVQTVTKKKGAELTSQSMLELVVVKAKPEVKKP